MSTLIRQGLEAKFTRLESLRLESVGLPPDDEPVVCATCYELSEDCFCVAPVSWPLSAVVYKLRAELALDGTA